MPMPERVLPEDRATAIERRSREERIVDVSYFCKVRGVISGGYFEHAFLVTWLVKSKEEIPRRVPCPMHPGLEGIFLKEQL